VVGPLAQPLFPRLTRKHLDRRVRASDLRRDTLRYATIRYDTISRALSARNQTEMSEIRLNGKREIVMYVYMSEALRSHSTIHCT